MKHILSCLFALSTMSCFAQQVWENNVKLNVSQLINEEIGVTYERAIDKVLSVQVRPSYFLSNPYQVNNGNYESSGYGVDVEGKFFFAHHAQAPDGFYLSPFFVSSWLTEEIDEDMDVDTDKYHYMQYGLSMGFQKIFNSHLVIDANIGNGRARSKGKELEDDDFDSPTSDFDGYLPRVSFGIGYNF